MKKGLKLNIPLQRAKYSNVTSLPLDLVRPPSWISYLLSSDWDETKQFCKCKRHVLSRDLCQWTFRAWLHASITIKEIDNMIISQEK